MSSRPAAFFDLDRTVLRVDSGISYMQFQRARGEISAFEMARAMWWGLQYRLAILDVIEVGNRLALEYAGQLEIDMIHRCRVWYEAYIAPQIAPRALRAIQRHRDAGEEIVLLTGATQYIAHVVADALDIEHTLCTRAEVRDGAFTGRLEQICFGDNKVRIAEKFADERGIDLDGSMFYSDSFNDLPMLQRVGTAVAINPDTRLRRHARRAGWRVESWL